MDSGVSPQAIVTCMCAAAVFVAAHAADPDCRIVYEGHLPKIEVNGERLEPDFRLTNYADELTDDAGSLAEQLRKSGFTVPDPTYDNQALRRLADCGFRIFRMHCDAGDGYRGDGRYDFSLLTGRARHILDQVPNAYLELTVNFGMSRWCAAHPDEVIQYGNGPADPKFPGDERIGRPVRGSAASEPFRRECRAALKELCSYVRSCPWGERVIALRICWGIYTEWHTYGMYQFPDTGPAMRKLFGRPVPTAAARRRDDVTMLDPVKDRDVLDYYRCHINAVSDFLLLAAKGAKAWLPGRLVGAYYGYVFSLHPPEGANTQLDKVLSSPDIDFLSCPPVYSAMTRRGGGSNMSRAVPSPFHRYGKLMMHEDDSRFHHLKGYVEQDIVMATPYESRAVMKRNYLNKLFDGCGIQLHDPSDQVCRRPYAFDDPHVLAALREARTAFKSVGDVTAESGNDLAVVVSPRERIRRGGGEKVSRTNALIYYDTPQFLWRTGTAFDMVTLEDFLAGENRWRTAVFLNVFHLTDAERERLEKLVRKPGFSAVWLVAPGSVTDAGFSDAAMCRLTGLRLEGSGPEPHVVCKDADAKSGVCGSVVKSLPDGVRSVFLPQPLRSAEEWRKVFESVGVQGYVPAGNYFRRHGDVMMYHVGGPVKTTVTVPAADRNRTVVELFGGRRFPATDIRVSCDRPETFLFRFEKPSDVRPYHAAVSPDGRNEIRLWTDDLSCEIVRDGVTVASRAPIALTVEGKVLRPEGGEQVVRERRTGFLDTPLYKKAKVDLSGNETWIGFDRWGVRLSARNDGVAYRFETSFPGEVRVDREQAPVVVPDRSARCWVNRTGAFGQEESLPLAFAAKDLKTDLRDGPENWTGNRMIYLPFVYSVGGKSVAVTESDVRDYPIWNLVSSTSRAAGVRFDAMFAAEPKTTFRAETGASWTELRELPSGGRWIKVREPAPWLVKTAGARTFPWRVFVLADDPSKFCEADIVFALAAPKAVADDFSWVRPGKVAWDWWNAFDNQGNDGCNTKTYERFIDFASKNGVEYVIFDEGWSESLNIWKFHPNVDVPHLIRYAEARGVGIILWMAWAQIVGEEERVAEHFAKLGAKGFKVDFMDRGDAKVAVFLEKFAAACARNRMLVDYHGVYRPTGLQRKYPNIVNYEGVHGLEQMKWFSQKPSDMMANDVRAFFLRMTAGPLDYTPGAMINHPLDSAYKGDARFPGSVGTRCRQMAMMALYEAPLQMLCDSPSNYEKNGECFAAMAAVPTVWDETVGLGGDPDTLAAVARRKGDNWYAAAITNGDARDFALKADFLGEGSWTMEIFCDAADADRKPTHYRHEKAVVKRGAERLIRLARGGGFLVRFLRQ